MFSYEKQLLCPEHRVWSASIAAIERSRVYLFLVDELKFLMVVMLKHSSCSVINICWLVVSLCLSLCSQEGAALRLSGSASGSSYPGGGSAHSASGRQQLPVLPLRTDLLQSEICISALTVLQSDSLTFIHWPIITKCSSDFSSVCQKQQNYVGCYVLI